MTGERGKEGEKGERGKEGKKGEKGDCKVSHSPPSCGLCEVVKLFFTS